MRARKAIRGRILRDPTTGAGLVIVQGQQHAFGLEGVWKSDEPPRVGAVVDVEFDASGRVMQMIAVAEARLVKEQAEAAIAQATAASRSAISRVGRLQTIAWLVTLFAWFFFAAVQVEDVIAGRRDFSFWNLLVGQGDADVWRTFGHGSLAVGIAAMVSFVGFTGPLLIVFWRDRRAHLGALLPLALVLLVLLSVFLGNYAFENNTSVISIAAGGYFTLFSAFFLAQSAIKQFLVAKARDEALFHQP